MNEAQEKARPPIKWPKNDPAMRPFLQAVSCRVKVAWHWLRTGKTQEAEEVLVEIANLLDWAASEEVKK